LRAEDPDNLALTDIIKIWVLYWRQICLLQLLVIVTLITNMSNFCTY
jgi:hypothetical protein